MKIKPSQKRKCKHKNTTLMTGKKIKVRKDVNVHELEELTSLNTDSPQGHQQTH